MKIPSLKTFLLATLIANSAFSLAAQPDHAAFSAVLTSHVRNGRVDYASIKKDGRFAPYLKTLAKTDVSLLKGKEILAFWINVYNAYTIKIVCDNFPLKSITDLAQGKVWDRPMVTIDGITYSLNELENDVVRPLGDNRIHFALVCAARSCPPLRSEAYRADILDAQLQEQARTFLTDQSRNDFDTGTHKATISHIFEWYLPDFGKTHVKLLQSISSYLPEAARASILKTPALWTVAWMDYDWSLNGK